MARDLTLSARLQLDAKRWEQGTRRGMTATQRFTAGVKREFAELRGLANSAAGALAMVGAGYAAGATIARSAHLDRDLEQVRQIAKATTDQTEALRQRVFALGKTYGIATDQAHEGFKGLVAGGLSWEQANTALGVMSQAAAVTKSSYTDLGDAMKSASANFGVNLSDLRETTKLINELATAADLGSAEIENLSSIFGSLGAAPSSAGMSRQRAMAYIEAMSGSVELGRLGNRVKSTMMLFNNQSYMREATKATGVEFYRNGERRDDIQVLKDIRDVIQAQPTQQARDQLLFKAFGKADVDMQQGVQFFTALQGNIERLEQMDQAINKSSMSGIADRVPAAINNAVDAAARLKSTLGAAADRFAQPINAAITNALEYSIGSKKDGGLDLSGEQIMGGGLLALLGLHFGRKGASKLIQKFGMPASLGTGVAIGTALEQAGAATPVYLVGAAPGVLVGGLDGLGGSVAGGTGGAAAASTGRKIGTAGLLARLGLLVAAIAAPVSMAVDPRNYDKNRRGIDPLELGGSDRGFDWARRGGNPFENFFHDLTTSTERPEVLVTVEVNDQRTRVTGVKVLGEVRATSSLRASSLKLGQMMSPGAW